MIVNFSIFDGEMNNLARKMKLTSQIDIKKFVSADMIKDKGVDTVYELFGIVNCEGESLKTSEYSSIVYRYDKETETSYWIKF